MSENDDVEITEDDLMEYEELSIRFGNGSGDGMAYCSIADILMYIKENYE